MKKDNLFYFFSLIPSLLFILVFMYYPLLGTIVESLHETSLLSSNPKFVGLKNYYSMFQEDDIYVVLNNSIIWTVSVVLLQNIFGYLCALVLNQSLFAKGLARAIILLPWIVPGVVGAILWKFMYDPQLGLINSFLLKLNIISESIAWLAEEKTVMASVVFAAFWKGFPFSTLIYLAALQNVSEDQIESSMIDGANALQRQLDIVLPSIKEIIIVNVVLTMILTFNYFDIVWILTKGGPFNLTHIFPTKIFELGFGQFRFGEASVFGVTSIIVLSGLIVLYFLFSFKKKVN